jgi:hypothetical protein
MNYTAQQIKDIVAEACSAATEAANLYFHTKLNGRDQYACGFAWVDIYGIKGNTKLGREMKAAGIRKDWSGKLYQLWNPSGHPAQNVDVKEAGARAAAEVLKRHGFQAHVSSRLD